MKYSKLILIIIALITVLFCIVKIVPLDVPSNIYNVVRCIIIGITVAIVGCAVVLILKVLIDTIKYIFVDAEDKTAPKHKIYKEVPRITATPIEAMHMVSSSFSLYHFDKMIISEILNLNKKGIIIFEDNELDFENPIIVKMIDLDETNRSKLTNIEKYIIDILEGMFDGDYLFLNELIEKIQIFIGNIMEGASINENGERMRNQATKIYIQVPIVVNKDFIANKIFDKKKAETNFNIVVRMGIFMITLAIPLFVFISLNVSEKLDKLLTLPFLWWHLLVFIGGFGFISSIFGLFKKDDYTKEGREEREKWKGFRNYLNSREIFDDIRVKNSIITEILPYLFVFNASKKLINFALDNMNETTIDMKAVKIMYKSVM